MKRVLTVFLTVVFMISSLSLPAFAEETIDVEIQDVVELDNEAFDDVSEDNQSDDISLGDIEIELGNDIIDSDAKEENTSSEEDESNIPADDETDVDLFGEGWDSSADVIDLLALGSEYYDSVSFEASEKVLTEDFEGNFNVSNLGVDIDFAGSVSLDDISIVKGADAKYGDEDGEVGIEDVSTGTDEGRFLVWSNRQADEGNVLKFFDVFNKDGLTNVDKNDKYALRFKLFVPKVDGMNRDKVQIILGTYSPKLYNANGSYPSNTETLYSSTPRDRATFIVPTGQWVDVFWDGYVRDADGNVTGGAPIVPGMLIMNQLGISSRMAMTTMYIDNLEVVRTEKASTYTVDANDMQPFDSSNYAKSDSAIGFETDAELGIDVLKIPAVEKNASGDVTKTYSYNYSPSSYMYRYIVDRGSVYRITVKAKKGAELEFNASAVAIDRSTIEGNDYKTSVKNDYTLKSGLNEDYAEVLSMKTTSNGVYDETTILFIDKGIKDETLYSGKKADIFRAFNISNVGDADAYVYDVTIAEVNMYSPVTSFNSSLDNWGWKTVSPLFVGANENVLNINASTSSDEVSISQDIALLKGAEYQLNYNGMSTDGETFVVSIVNNETGDVISEVSQVLNSSMNQYYLNILLDGEYTGEDYVSASIKIKAANDAMTVSNLSLYLINGLINVDAQNEDSLIVTGDLSEYTVNAPKIYLLLNSLDNTDPIDEADIFLNADRTYEVVFDNIGDEFSVQYYNTIYVVIEGIDGIPYVAKTLEYESAKIKADLIRSIANASNYQDIVTVIKGKSGTDQVNNDLILGLDELDIYNDTKSILNDVAKIMLEYKDNILNPDNYADETQLCEEYLFAATLAGANTGAVQDAFLVEYVDQIIDRIDIAEEGVYANLYSGISDNDKKAVMRVLKNYSHSNNSENEDEFKAIFLDSIFRNKINNCISYSDIMVYVSNYKTFLGIDDTEWQPFEDVVGTKYYTQAQIQIAKFAKATSDIHTIDDNIASLVTTAKQIVDANDNSGPSGRDNTPTINMQINVSENKFSDKPAVEFSDLGSFEWAEEYIDILISTGAVAGYEDGTFRPANNITRSEFAKILSVALDVYDENAKCEYTDIPEDNWGVSYIGSLAKLDVIKGKTDGSFGANDHISRQDVAVLVYRLVNKLGIKLPIVNRPSEFADSDLISDYAKEAVSALYQAGVISGVGDYRFDPLGYANRAQAAKIIAFFVE